MPSKTLRRWECALLVLAAALTLFCSWLGGYRECLSGKLLRLHVVANSDSDADQALKLEVRGTRFWTAPPGIWKMSAMCVRQSRYWVRTLRNWPGPGRRW